MAPLKCLSKAAGADRAPLYHSRALFVVVVPVQMKRLCTFWDGKGTRRGTSAQGGVETPLTAAGPLLPLITPAVRHEVGLPKQDVLQPGGLLGGLHG